MHVIKIFYLQFFLKIAQKKQKKKLFIYFVNMGVQSYLSILLLSQFVELMDLMKSTGSRMLSNSLLECLFFLFFKRSQYMDKLQQQDIVYIPLSCFSALLFSWPNHLQYYQIHERCDVVRRSTLCLVGPCTHKLMEPQSEPWSHLMLANISQFHNQFAGI